jgi:hypothetical protein
MKIFRPWWWRRSRGRVPLPFWFDGQSVFYSRSESELDEEIQTLAPSDKIYFVRVRLIQPNGDPEAMSSSAGSRRRNLNGDQDTQKVELVRQVASLPQTEFANVHELIKGEREGIVDSFAESGVDLIWQPLTAQWVTTDPSHLAELSEAISSLNTELQKALIGDPVEFASSALQIPDPSLLGIVAEHVPIPGIGKSFAEVKTYLEIAGIVIGLAGGGPLLACASFKLLIHDEMSKLLVRAADRAIQELTSAPVPARVRAGPADRAGVPASGAGRRVGSRPTADRAGVPASGAGRRVGSRPTAKTGREPYGRHPDTSRAGPAEIADDNRDEVDSRYNRPGRTAARGFGRGSIGSR